MNLKKTLKNIKLNESIISMFLGLFVIALVGFLVFNYFRNLGGGEITKTGEEDILLPTTHVVEDGEDLWSISKTYYNSGYNWVDIAEANNIDNPNMVVVGQEIIIPDVTPILLVEDTQDLTQAETLTPTIKPTATPTNTPAPIVDVNTKIDISQSTEYGYVDSPITSNSYTVVRGDNLWNIAVRAYGDGFRWVEIAEANELINPSLIHRGNVFIIPRY